MKQRRIRQSRTCHLHFILSLANSWHFGTTDGCIKLPSFAIGFDLRWHLKCQSQYRSLHFKCQEFARVRGMSFQLHFGTWHCQEMLRSPGKHNCRWQVLDCRMRLASCPEPYRSCRNTYMVLSHILISAFPPLQNESAFFPAAPLCRAQDFLSSGSFWFLPSFPIRAKKGKLTQRQGS